MLFASDGAQLGLLIVSSIPSGIVIDRYSYEGGGEVLTTKELTGHHISTP